MKVTILSVGILKKGLEKELFDTYAKRFSWGTLEVKEIPQDKKNDLQCQNNILKAIPTKGYVVALDMGGDIITSLQLSDLLITSGHHGSITFIIGGAFGLTPDILKRAHKVIAFGKVTWPHLLMRGLLMEQLYRAQQILLNHPYHQE